jgi:outer membrane protein TolC
MYYIKTILILLFLNCLGINTSQIIAQSKTRGQTKLTLSLSEVIKLSQEQSPQSIRAKHEFRGKYWEFRSYKAERLPNLMLNSTPVYFNQSIVKSTILDTAGNFLTQSGNIKEMRSDAEVSLNQNIGFTGGSIFVKSGLGYIKPLNQDIPENFDSKIVSIGFNQPLNGYNALRWQKKIEPLKFEEATRNYMYGLESVSLRAVNLFFDLAMAQITMSVAKTNFSNADTLFKIAQGRYNIGTIAENELLQMELSKLNAASRVNLTKVDLEYKKSQLRSFLGYNETVDIEIELPAISPKIILQSDSVLSQAFKNNPNIISFERQILEANRDVAQARAEKTFSASISAEYGLNKSAPTFDRAYKEPGEMQMAQIGLNIPLVDWGMRRGRYRMAQSNREVIKSTVEQQRTDFEQDIFLKVMQFNFQNEQLYTASKADTVAQLRYNVIKQRFLIGKISITDLNIAVSEKDEASLGYVNALRNYWNNLYEIRRITLFDFIENKPITVNIDDVIR